MSNETTIQALGTKAESVAMQEQAMDAAFDEEIQAEAAVLDAAVAAVRPALKALSSRIRSVYWSRTDQQSGLAEETIEHFGEVRGFRIAGEGAKKERGNGGGDWSGSALYLLEDGRFADVAYRGHWTAWIGSRSGWEATINLQSAAEAMEGWELDGALAGISKALDEWLRGNAQKRTKAALERAEKLRAIMALAK